MSEFDRRVRNAVHVDDGEIAEIIADADLAEYHIPTEVPEDEQDENPVTEVEIHEDLGMEIEAAVEEAARSIRYEYEDGDSA